jgi:hypothetical protein
MSEITECVETAKTRCACGEWDVKWTESEDGTPQGDPVCYQCKQCRGFVVLPQDEEE